MPTIERATEYRVSERVKLVPGVRFRASGGPLFKLKGGDTVSMAAKGPFVFRAFCRKGAVEWIEASDREGAAAILHIKGRRKKVDECLVPRPYKIGHTIRKKGRQR